MLNTIKELLQRVFYQPSDVELFISSKNPKNAGDVEHWIRIYTQGGQYGR